MTMTLPRYLEIPIQAPPLVEDDQKLQGRVNLEIHCAGSIPYRHILLLYHGLSAAEAVQVLRLSPNRDGGVTLELRVREPLALTGFLKLLPGVSQIKEEAASYSSDDTPTMHLVLGGKLAPYTGPLTELFA